MGSSPLFWGWTLKHLWVATTEIYLKQIQVNPPSHKLIKLTKLTPPPFHQKKHKKNFKLQKSMEIWVNFQRQGQERYGTWIESTLNWTWQRLQLRPEGPIFFFPCHRFGVEVVSKACGLADLAANLDPNKIVFEVPVFLQTYTPVAQNDWKNFGLLLFFFEREVVVLELLFCNSTRKRVREPQSIHLKKYGSVNYLEDPS